MRPERWAEVQRLFSRAKELPPEEREEFVRAEAGADADLAHEVLRMLRAAPESGFLLPPAQPAHGASEIPRRMGDFELLEEIGRGGMGIVYRARQVSLGREVAIKVLPPSLTLTQRQIDRFQREARAAARLHHPNIVAILTVGQEGQLRFFAMELVRGLNLAEELKRLREETATSDDSSAHLPSSHAETYFRRVAEVVRQAADGLHHGHEHKIVHRDVKPSNLLLDPEGNVRIVDFGLARDEEQGAITQTGELAGTPHYMSPEQARARRQRVDHRTDVYSLGVVLYELLTLRRPFEGRSSQEVIRNILEREPPRIRRLNPRVPRDLELVCMSAMAKELSDRYPSAAEFRDDLARFLAHEAIRARPPSLLQVAGRFAWRRRRALGGLVLTLGALWITMLVTSERARRRRVSQLVDGIAAARAEAPLRDLPLSRQLEVRRALSELRSVLGAGDVEALPSLRGVEAELTSLRSELEQQGRESLARSREAARSEGECESLRLSGLQTLLHASHLFPEDGELADLSSVESAFPTLAVRAVDQAGSDIGGEVYSRAIDVFTSGLGARHLLGRAPLPPTPILPGYYRVVVLFDAGGFRELVCNPGPACLELELVARRRADEDTISSGMVLVPAMEFTFPEFEGERCFQGRTVHLDSYWVDATEVSNAQYGRFLESTGRRPPPLWQRPSLSVGEFLDRHGELPVATVTWTDAVAYAEWAGKRLLTAGEWHRAAGGPAGWPFPYSSDPDAPPRGNVLAPDETVQTKEERYDQYLRYAAPVRSHEEARTPEGLYHMYGNVTELTESMAVTLVDEATLRPRPFDRFAFGQPWNARAWGNGMRCPDYMGIGPNYPTESIGFRCAKSAAP